jgi:hypothetical protein
LQCVVLTFPVSQNYAVEVSSDSGSKIKAGQPALLIRRPPAADFVIPEYYLIQSGYFYCSARWMS